MHTPPCLFLKPIDYGVYAYDPSTDFDLCGEVGEEKDRYYQTYVEEQRSRKMLWAAQKFKEKCRLTCRRTQKKMRIVLRDIF